MDVLSWPLVTSGMSTYSLAPVQRDWRAASQPARGKHTCRSCFPPQNSMTYLCVQFQHKVQEQFY